MTQGFDLEKNFFYSCSSLTEASSKNCEAPCLNLLQHFSLLQLHLQQSELVAQNALQRFRNAEGAAIKPRAAMVATMTTIVVEKSNQNPSGGSECVPSVTFPPPSIKRTIKKKLINFLLEQMSIFPPAVQEDLEKAFHSFLDPNKGPFVEFFNVLTVFLVMQALRLVISVMTLIAIECFTGFVIRDKLARRKIASNAWYAVYYTGAVLLGLRIAWKLDLFSIHGGLRDVCLHEHAETTLTRWPQMQIFHRVQVAFYFNYLFAMATGIDARRKDEKVFIFHHVITLLLILFSRNWGYIPMQMAVLIVHDAADPFVHIARFITLVSPRRTWLADLFFAMFAIVFFVTRWFVYPVFLIEQCRRLQFFYYPRDYSYSDYTFMSVGPNSLTFAGFSLSFFGIGVLLLYALLALHMYWGIYILRVIWRKLFEGQQDADPNDEKEKTD